MTYQLHNIYSSHSSSLHCFTGAKEESSCKCNTYCGKRHIEYTEYVLERCEQTLQIIIQITDQR